jgi:hypothetical protein
MHGNSKEGGNRHIGGRGDHGNKTFKVFEAQDQSSLIIEGNHNLVNLKAAVIIAYIYEEGEETTTLMYAPV